MTQAAQKPERFGPYNLLRLLAEGGMGSVLLAENEAKTPVVIKVMQPSLARDRTMVSMFLHEARLGAMLRHPGIAVLTDYGSVDGIPYLAMEYVDGASLSRVRRLKDVQAPLEATLEIVKQVARALDYAHQAVDPAGNRLNIVHRDVTPHNILVSKHGEVKLIDFGVAKSEDQDHRTKTGVLKGKLAYMAPEQFHGKATSQTDVFALGIILWELIVGRRLFRRETQAATFAAVLGDPIPPVEGLDEDEAAVLSPIVSKALERGLDSRYKRASELADDIAVAMRTLGLSCEPKTLAYLALKCPVPPEPSRISASGIREQWDAEQASDSVSLSAVSDREIDVTTSSPVTLTAQPRVDRRPQRAQPVVAVEDIDISGLTPRRGSSRYALLAIAVLIGVGVGSAIAYAALTNGSTEAPVATTAGSNTASTDPGAAEDPAVATGDSEEEANADEPVEDNATVDDEVGDEVEDEVEVETEDPVPAAPQATDEVTEPVVQTERRLNARQRAGERAAAKAQRPPPPAAPSGEPGRLFLDTNPWTYVRLGGRNLGTTPIVNAEVPAGNHTLTLREGGGETHRLPIRIRPGAATKRVVNLRN